MATYNILVGIDYGDKRVEAGDTASDLPSKSISWLLEQGIIELASESSAPKAVKKSTSVEQEIA